MTYDWNPKLKDLFKREKIVVVKTEYRRLYKINWKNLFINLTALLAFWRPTDQRKYTPKFIVPNNDDNVIAQIGDNLIKDIPPSKVSLSDKTVKEKDEEFENTLEIVKRMKKNS